MATLQQAPHSSLSDCPVEVGQLHHAPRLLRQVAHLGREVEEQVAATPIHLLQQSPALRSRERGRQLGGQLRRGDTAKTINLLQQSPCRELGAPPCPQRASPTRLQEVLRHRVLGARLLLVGVVLQAQGFVARASFQPPDRPPKNSAQLVHHDEPTPEELRADRAVASVGHAIAVPGGGLLVTTQELVLVPGELQGPLDLEQLGGS